MSDETMLSKIFERLFKIRVVKPSQNAASEVTLSLTTKQDDAVSGKTSVIDDAVVKPDQAVVIPVIAEETPDQAVGTLKSADETPGSAVVTPRSDDGTSGSASGIETTNKIETVLPVADETKQKISYNANLNNSINASVIGSSIATAVAANEIIPPSNQISEKSITQEVLNMNPAEEQNQSIDNKLVPSANIPEIQTQDSMISKNDAAAAESKKMVDNFLNSATNKIVNIKNVDKESVNTAIQAGIESQTHAKPEYKQLGLENTNQPPVQTVDFPIKQQTPDSVTPKSVSADATAAATTANTSEIQNPDNVSKLHDNGNSKEEIEPKSQLNLTQSSVVDDSENKSGDLPHPDITVAENEQLGPKNTNELKETQISNLQGPQTHNSITPESIAVSNNQTKPYENQIVDSTQPVITVFNLNKTDNSTSNAKPVDIDNNKKPVAIPNQNTNELKQNGSPTNIIDDQTRTLTNERKPIPNVVNEISGPYAESTSNNSSEYIVKKQNIAPASEDTSISSTKRTVSSTSPFALHHDKSHAELSDAESQQNNTTLKLISDDTIQSNTNVSNKQGKSTQLDTRLDNRNANKIKQQEETIFIGKELESIDDSPTSLPLYAQGSDPIIQISEQSLVYSYDKQRDKIFEYATTIDNKPKMREVRLSADKNSIEVSNDEGKTFEKITKQNFEDYYHPKSKEEEGIDTKIPFEKIQTGSIAILNMFEEMRERHSQMKPNSKNPPNIKQNTDYNTHTPISNRPKTWVG